jgi:aspartate/tyrosine/aromatic aminotransferase
MRSNAAAFRRLSNSAFVPPLSAPLRAAEMKGAEAAGAAAVDPLAHIKPAPLDPILGTKIMYDRDQSPHKVNLGIGAYRTDEGKPYVLQAVRKAEALIMGDASLTKEYLSQSGHPGFCKVARDLMFGAESEAVKSGRIATVQGLSGTGSLRIGAAFINRFFPDAQVLYSEPTWSNHISILNDARVPHRTYRYWDAGSRRLNLDGMLEDIKKAPPGSFVLLHASAHNPTGVDPTLDQWRSIAKVMKDRGLFAFFDAAYQGFASGDLVRDVAAVRMFVDMGFNNLLACQSFAKNFGLYNERVGSFSVVCRDKDQAAAVTSQLELIIRAMYSNPPAHGALIVWKILSDPALYKLWESEMKQMAERIKSMRQLLFNALKRLGTPGDWSHITSQIGMFSYTGLSKEQCSALINKHHVYLLMNGRISMAGVTSKNVEYLAAAIDDAVRTAK